MMKIGVFFVCLLAFSLILRSITMATKEEGSVDGTKPIVRLRAVPSGPRCPFEEPVEFSLSPGSCVSLVASSGMGKTTLGTVLSGLPGHGAVLKKLDIQIEEFIDE